MCSTKLDHLVRRFNLMRQQVWIIIILRERGRALKKKSRASTFGDSRVWHPRQMKALGSTGCWSSPWPPSCMGWMPSRTSCTVSAPVTLSPTLTVYHTTKKKTPQNQGDVCGRTPQTKRVIFEFSLYEVCTFVPNPTKYCYVSVISREWITGAKK